jgi:hypothetical protein
MIKITNLHPARGRVACTFTADVAGLTLPGCALINREGGYTLSIPRVGQPGQTKPAPLSAVHVGELERVAVEALNAARVLPGASGTAGP